MNSFSGACVAKNTVVYTRAGPDKVVPNKISNLKPFVHQLVGPSSLCCPSPSNEQSEASSSHRECPTPVGEGVGSHCNWIKVQWPGISSHSRVSLQETLTRAKVQIHVNPWKQRQTISTHHGTDHHDYGVCWQSAPSPIRVATNHGAAKRLPNPTEPTRLPWVLLHVSRASGH